MLKIKLHPFGKKHAILYRVVVREENTKLTSAPTAVLGTYNPKTNDVKVDTDLAKSWIAKGAQPTASVRKILNGTIS